MLTVEVVERTSDREVPIYDYTLDFNQITEGDHPLAFKVENEHLGTLVSRHLMGAIVYRRLPGHRAEIRLVAIELDRLLQVPDPGKLILAVGEKKEVPLLEKRGDGKTLIFRASLREPAIALPPVPAQEPQGIVDGTLKLNGQTIRLQLDTRGGETEEEGKAAFLFFLLPDKGLYVFAPFPIEGAQWTGEVTGPRLFVTVKDQRIELTSRRPIFGAYRGRIWIWHHPEYRFNAGVGVGYSTDPKQFGFRRAQP